MSELHHECGLAAVYNLTGQALQLSRPYGNGRLSKGDVDPDYSAAVSRWIPNMLLDMQNRGQLAAGMTSYTPGRKRLLLTYKDIGSVNEVFRLAHRGKRESLMRRYGGQAAIGHVRYATSGADDRNNAQPFERKHLQRSKWFSFAFNGQLANYPRLRKQLLADKDHHLSRDVDTEIILHAIARQLSESPQPDYFQMMRSLGELFDGAYSLALLDARGRMLVARDPLGIKPLCYVLQDGVFAAASESVALVNLGFDPDTVRSLEPGAAAVVSPEGVRIQRFVDGPVRRAHCFFEWIYFANVASTLDERSVYLSRTALGEELAKMELAESRFPLDANTIVVPVPDTSKPAADAMAHVLGLPCREGLIRNRYSGRTFIEGGEQRIRKANSKYTPLRDVLQGKRVILVEDSIVRSTTMRALLGRIRHEGGAREIHVRVACPPIVAPCYYGIDMSTINELFAPEFLPDGKLTREAEIRMAEDLGAESLKYLPVEAVAQAIGRPGNELCQACISRGYPTPAGQQRFDRALGRYQHEQGQPAVT